MNNRYRTALCLTILVFSILGNPHPQLAVAQEDTTCPGALPSRLVPGEGGRVTPGAPNNVRNQPSAGAQKVGEIQAGTEFEVLEGPVCADGYAWWHIQYPWKKDGWTVESAGGQYALEPYPTVIMLDGNEITYENLTFSFDPALGSGVKVKVYEPFLPSPQTPDFAVRPNDTRITLRDYPIMHRGDWSGDEPVIWVFPADEYANLVDMADQTIIKMREYLRQVDSLPPSAFTGEEIVPALPLVNANMIFQAHRQALQFQNGTGFRFITAYGQNIVAMEGYNNYIYSFQGLTSNGQYWISVQFPVSFPLPTGLPPENSFDWEHPEVYYDQALELLQAMPSSAFTPDLELLDAMVGSMFVTGGGDRLEPAPTTATEVAAETPAVAAPGEETVFSDTFNDNTADWKIIDQEGLSAGIQDGKYIIDLTTTTTFQDWVFAPGYTNWALAPQVQPPFEFEFEFSNVQSDTGKACLAVFMGITEKYATFTMLSVCQDGSWSISELKEGSLQPLGTSGFNMPVRILDGGAHKLRLRVEPGGPPGWNLYRFAYDDQPLGELLLPGQLNEGTIGFGITSFSSDPVVALHAEFDNVVVRQLEATPSAEPVAPPAAAETINCTVSAGGANIRSGPGTNYNSIGTLSSGQAATGQRTDTDGFVWWQLASGGWVRSDVVTEQGDCERLPVVSPESPASAAPIGTEPSLPRSYTSTSEKLTFAYPAGWFVSEASGVVILSNNPVTGAALLTDSDWSFNRGEIVVLLIPNAANPGLTKQDIAKEIFQMLDGTADVVESIQVSDQSGVVASGSSDSLDILSIVFDLADDRIMIVAAVTRDGEMGSYMSTIGAIALSVRAAP